MMKKAKNAIFREIFQWKQEICEFSWSDIDFYPSSIDNFGQLRLFPSIWSYLLPALGHK